MRRGCFRVSSLGTDVSRVFRCPLGAVGRCVSSADTSLSLSLSLSCPSSASGLTAKSPCGGVSFAGRAGACLARGGVSFAGRAGACSAGDDDRHTRGADRLARGDDCLGRGADRCPRGVRRDRSLVCTARCGRRAHRVSACSHRVSARHASGGLVGIRCPFGDVSCLGGRVCGEVPSRALRRAGSVAGCRGCDRGRGAGCPSLRVGVGVMCGSVSSLRVGGWV